MDNVSVEHGSPRQGKLLTANRYFRERFGHKMYKACVSLDVACPNRDGTCGTGGCFFCSAEGSGEFSQNPSGSITRQIDSAVSSLASKVPPDTGYIAYFQSFTSTYCDPSYLRKSLDEAISHPLVEALSIGTRPDCLPPEIIDVLKSAAFRIPVFVELGLQTSNDRTAESFNRGYPTSVYDEAVKILKESGINVITHIIFGLPGETREMMLESVSHSVKAGTDGLKFTCLYVLRGTVYGKLYEEGRLAVFDREEYFDIVEEALGLVPSDVVIHRLTGDGPKKLLIAPLWTADKRSVVNYINGRFRELL